MATRLKNKYVSTTAYLLGVMLLGYTVVAAFNFAFYYEYAASDSYFKSIFFRDPVTRLTYDIHDYHLLFKNYSQKTIDEKVSTEELEEAMKRYEENLKNRQAEITNNYKWQIDEANERNDKDQVEKLTEERDKFLETARLENTKSTDELKKEIVQPKEDAYNRAKSNIENQKSIKYYITDKKTGEIYTNITDVSNIGDYITRNTMHSEKYPMELSNYRDVGYDEINRVFQDNHLEGYFIVPAKSDSYNSIYRDLSHFEYVRKRLYTEGMAGGIALMAALILFVISAVFRSNEPTIGSKLQALYVKIPVELRLLGIFLISLGYLDLFFEFGPQAFGNLEIGYSAYVFASSLYLLFVLLHLKGIYNLLTKKDNFLRQRKGTFIYMIWAFFKKSWLLLTEALGLRNILVCVFAIMVLSAFVGMMAIAFFEIYTDFGRLIIFLIIAAYFVFIPRFVLRQVGYINKVITGSEAIAAGNLGYAIEEKGRGSFARLAHNINNIKSGLKKALESEIKSERMKSELITNVSHDLKTPLTSIINYVDLLKREDLSQEEINGYVGILERKTQRLKALIEDLFEASKMASGAVELNMEKVDIAALLSQALAEFEEKIKASSLVFKVNGTKQKVYANLDGKKTWRVFENLVGNILKYSQPGTRVYIDLMESESNIILTMKNISAYEMDFAADEIFERFTRGDSSRHTEGSGLGLSIAKSIVELQGGKLDIEIDGDLFKVIIEFYK